MKYIHNWMIMCFELGENIALAIKSTFCQLITALHASV